MAWFRRACLGIAAAAAGLCLSAAPASAHTSLESSTPANGTSLASAPATAHLVFATAVNPKTTSLQTLNVSGVEIPGTTLATSGDASTKTMDWKLPTLPNGTFGLRWLSVGDDGHKVTGDIIFTIGNKAATSASAAAGPTTASTTTNQTLGAEPKTSGPGVLSFGAAFGRFVWYIGLALALGALWMQWWAGRDSNDTCTLVSTTARNALRLGIPLTIAAGALRVFCAAFAIATATRGEGLFVRWMDALTRPSFSFWLLAAAALFAARNVASRNHVGSARIISLVAALVGAAGVFSVYAGHSVGLQQRALESLHLLAASIWIGPLLVLVATIVTPAWSETDSDERRLALRSFVKAYGHTAKWAVIVLVVTGVNLAWIRAGHRPVSGYVGLLAAKSLLLVAVLLPLAAYHHRSKIETATSNRKFGRLHRTLRLEAVTLVLVLALAAALGGTAPAPLSTQNTPVASTVASPAVATATAAAETTGTPASYAECTARALGQLECYQAFFVAIEDKDGPTKALDQVDAASKADQGVQAQCHQIVHAIGREAAVKYSLAQALTTQSSICWSGYYHGVMEETLSKVSETDLPARLATVCVDPSITPASFSDYNCSHGVGHGLMMRYNNDVFASLPHCSSLASAYEKSSCVGGIFMQNIIAAEDGETTTLKTQDPLYPCDSVATDYKGDCYAMQTSWILNINGADFAKTAELCKTVETGFVATCFNSMGRDASGSSLLDPDKVIAICNLAPTEFQPNCIEAASANAVFDRHDAVKANELCAKLSDVLNTACTTARDNSLHSFT